MKNELFSIGPVTIYGYGLMMALGIVSAYLIVEYRVKKRGIDADKFFNMAILAVAGGLLGAKILYLLTRLPELIADPSLLWDNIMSGFVVYGSIIGGILAAWLYCRKAKLDFLLMFDLTVPALAFAQGVGRIGCYLAGCCYGMEVPEGTACAITFTNSAYAPNNVPLFPAQLVSSALNFIHFGILMLLSKKLKYKGQVGGFYLVFYSIGRFILEFFRGDIIRGNVGEFTTSQFIAIFTFLAGIAVIALMPKLHKNEQTSEEIQTESQS